MNYQLSRWLKHREELTSITNQLDKYDEPYQIKEDNASRGKLFAVFTNGTDILPVEGGEE